MAAVADQGSPHEHRCRIQVISCRTVRLPVHVDKWQGRQSAGRNELRGCIGPGGDKRVVGAARIQHRHFAVCVGVKQGVGCCVRQLHRVFELDGPELAAGVTDGPVDVIAQRGGAERLADDVGHCRRNRERERIAVALGLLLFGAAQAVLDARKRPVMVPVPQRRPPRVALASAAG